MNPNTGDLYIGPDEINAAKGRGEPLVYFDEADPGSPEWKWQQDLRNANRKERRKMLAEARRQKRKKGRC